jgi:catechol 2,3-dioxygenase-like lactoylglutathione lyase family enzyme
MERSVRFYQQLGFNKVNDFTVEDPSVGDGLGIKANKVHGVFMRLGDDANAPVLDLVQFVDPPTQGQPYSSLNNVGICRIAFAVDDIDKTYEDLKKMDVEFVAPLKTIEGVAGAKTSFVCFKDPDGTVLELISGM